MARRRTPPRRSGKATETRRARTRGTSLSQASSFSGGRRALRALWSPRAPARYGRPGVPEQVRLLGVGLCLPPLAPSGLLRARLGERLLAVGHHAHGGSGLGEVGADAFHEAALTVLRVVLGGPVVRLV